MKKNIDSKKQNKSNNISLYEKKLKTIFKAAPIGIGIIKNRKFEEVNDEFQKMIGYKKSELIGKSSRIIYSNKKEFDFVGREKYKQIDKKGKGTVITKFKTKKGKCIDVLLSSVPIDRQDYTKGVVFTAEDITNKITAEEKLKNSEEKFRKVFDTNPDSITIVNLKNKKYVSVNDGFLKCSGLKLSQVIGKTSDELNIFYNNQEKLKFVNLLKKKGSVENFEATFVNKKGIMKYGLLTATIIELDGEKHILTITKDITNFEMISEELKQSEEKFRKAFDTDTDAIAINRISDGKYTLVNKAFLKISGYKENEVIGITSKELNIWKNPNDREELLKRLQKNKTVSNMEIQFILKNGNVKYGLMSATIIQIDNVDYILSLTRDISDRKRIENQLKISQQNYQQIFDNMIDMAFVINMQGNVIDVNKAATQTLGYTREELCKLSPLNFDAELSTKQIKQLLKKMPIEKFQFFETTHKTKDGRKIPVEIKSTMINYFGDQVVLSIASDITERKKAEENLKQSEEKFRKAFELNPDAASITKIKDRKYILVNKSFLKNTGYAEKEIIGKTAEEIKIWRNPKERQIFVNKLKEKGAINNFEASFKGKNGKQLFGLISSSIIEINGEGCVLSIIRDITESKKIEIELQNSYQNYQHIFNGMKDMAIVFDQKGNIIDVNDETLNRLGYSKEEMLKLTPFDIDSNFTPKEIKSTMKKMNKSNFLTFETTHRTKQNKSFPVEVKLTQIDYFGKKVILNIATDISERKKAEAIISESEKKYRSLYQLLNSMSNNLPDMLWAKDLNKKYLFANKAICKNLLNAKNTNEPLGKTDIFFANRERTKHPKNIKYHTFGELCQDSDQIVLDTLKPERFDEFGNVKNKFLFLDVHKAPFYDSNGELIGTVGSARDITNEKKIEEELKRSEQNLKIFFNSIDEFIFILDDNGLIVEVNKTVLDRLGYSRTYLIGKPVLAVHPQELRGEVIQIVSDMLAGNRLTCPIPLKTKSNKLIPVETRIKKGTWNGKPAIFGITKDISELEVSKEKFSKAFQNNPAIAGLSDLETGEYVEVNKTFYDKLEYTPKEVIGKKASEVVKMESKFREKTLSKLKKYNSIENVETVLYTKSGKPLNVILNAEIIVIDGRKFNYTSAIDITEKLEYEKILKINEENYRKFFENDITADSLIAADGTILSCNPSFAKLFGFKSCEDVVGYNAKLFFHSEKEMRYHFNRVIKEGKILNLEIELQDIKGEKKQVITNVVGEYDEQGKIKQFRSYINDITHKKKIEEELEKYRLQLEDLVKERTIELESEIIKRRKAEEQAMIALEKEKELGQLKSKFISTVSHEFRTPLTSIYSSVELIERYSSKWDNSQKSEHFSRIKTSIDHLTNMLEEVLRLNRSQSSSVEFNPNKIDLNIFCKNLINDLEPLLSKNNKLFYNFNIPLKNYLADENLLKVILTNLISNAIKYSLNGGNIYFDVDENEKQIIFKVKDEGIGIGKEEIEKIFTPFYRSARNSTIAGSGLGLSITKSYVEVHKGTIEVKSQKDKGAIFTIKIPKRVYE